MIETERRFVDSFADAWDMPSIGTVEQYTAGLEDASLKLETVENITSHSVGRFRKWTMLYLQLLGSPIRSLIERLLRAFDLDPTAITETGEGRAPFVAVPAARHPRCESEGALTSLLTRTEEESSL